ncbi:DEKNAAC103703 [Brettanomyces naardenensis]|uniref:DEKNAAC103703 n=1 Tax=Brettanomyces naardenensis TaxID=13370 RepID=A0A448YN16_BRENA|nr:DEKNAAC103703 [Brettanomyces naardenensis]
MNGKADDEIDEKGVGDTKADSADNKKGVSDVKVDTENVGQAVSDTKTVVENKPATDSNSTPNVSTSEKDSSTPTPRPKRLTLQERLELAARKGASAARKHRKREDRENSPLSSDSSTRPSTPPSTMDVVLREPESEGFRIPDNYRELTKEQLVILVEKSKTHCEAKSGEDIPEQIKDLEKKLEQKQKLVDQLRDEGTKLSAKEVSLLQTIKKMRQREIDGDKELEEAGKDIKKLEDKMRGITDKNKQLEDEISVLKKLKGQLDKSAKDLQDERKNSDNAQKKLKRLEAEYDEFERKKSAEVKQLRSKLNDETANYNRAIKDSEEEVKRIEEKMEALRNESERRNVSGLKKIDTTGTGSPVDLLQTQYSQAQENWKMIESSYQKRLADMERNLNLFKQRDVGYSEKMKSLSTDLRERTGEVDELLDTENGLRQMLANSQKQLSRVKSDLDTMTQNYSTLQNDYELEKVEFEGKLKNLMEEKTRLGETLKLRTEAISDDSNTSFTPAFYLNDLNTSGNSVGFSHDQKRRSSSTNIYIGESATTPKLSASQSSFKVQPTGPTLQEMSVLDSSGMFSHDDGSGTSTVDALEPGESSMSNAGAAASNIQLVSRLSSRVRRLELELLSLREDNADLSKLRTEASNEIVKLMKQSEQAGQFERKAAEADEKITEINQKYEATLELLGEKSERCSELEADVDDLKDLLRQQVQQMVEMQGKIDER